ncbi:cytochrome-c oxidase subunit VIIa [Gymnopilus junonius]|uniref:Cytochrome c oxidase subunit 9, mitochondrial n=1 Tax=Gymnopilus junonius TaxID=109634 RepID=A0A9P5NTP0_GYMJU|nr:cytochrome-c oxidase subunit VIIa [Gymnopilus junonius]
MAIAPITGKLRKRFWLDLGCALGLGVSAGYTWWYGYHLKALENQENYYIKLEKERAKAA